MQKRNRNQGFQQIFLYLFTAYKSFTVAGRWQQPECLSVAEWINQMFGVEYYLALKRRFWFMLPRGEPCGQPNFKKSARKASRPYGFSHEVLRVVRFIAT